MRLCIFLCCIIKIVISHFSILQYNLLLLPLSIAFEHGFYKLAINFSVSGTDFSVA